MCLLSSLILYLFLSVFLYLLTPEDPNIVEVQKHNKNDLVLKKPYRIPRKLDPKAIKVDF